MSPIELLPHLSLMSGNSKSEITMIYGIHSCCKRWSHCPTAPFNLGQGLPLGSSDLFLLFSFLHVSSWLFPESGNRSQSVSAGPPELRLLAMSYAAAGELEATRSGRGRARPFFHTEGRHGCFIRGREEGQNN